jgi:hypothetical protein
VKEVVDQGNYEDLGILDAKVVQGFNQQMKFNVVIVMVKQMANLDILKGNLSKLGCRHVNYRRHYSSNNPNISLIQASMGQAPKLNASICRCNIH